MMRDLGTAHGRHVGAPASPENRRLRPCAPPVLPSTHAWCEHGIASEQTRRLIKPVENPRSSPDRVPNHGVRAPEANKIPANSARVMTADNLTQSAQA
jgi:hypothetical protein